MGGRPRWRSAAPRVLSGRETARQAHPGRHIAGAGPLSGEGRTMCDPELVARAQRAATRLESAWEQWQAQLPQVPFQQVPLQSGPLQSGPLQLTESAPDGTGEYPSSALLGAPVHLGRGRQSADQARDRAGWTSGELPGQVNEQLASWPPSADQPPASA